MPFPELMTYTAKALIAIAALCGGTMVISMIASFVPRPTVDSDTVPLQRVQRAAFAVGVLSLFLIPGCVIFAEMGGVA